MVENNIKIKINNVSKSFTGKDGTTPVLDNISFDVSENEFLVILGPGQCGKTILLNLIYGMIPDYEGDIIFPDGDSNVGFVFQRYVLFDWKNVLKNVALPLKLNGVPKKQRYETARKYIDLVGLNGFENSYPAELSGGMKQRVGIARAYTTGRKIILMDEPFGALDAQTRYQMQDELLRIRQTEKTTVMFVTNNIEEAIYLGDRILLFSSRPAKIVGEYIPDLPRPRNNTSAEFMALRDKITSAMDLSL